MLYPFSVISEPSRLDGSNVVTMYLKKKIGIYEYKYEYIYTTLLKTEQPATVFIWL